MTGSFIRDAIHTPIGRFGGTLGTIRADDLATIPLARGRNPS
jgi:acetyl-CoA acetyltransferase